MGAETFLLASSMNAVVAQRVVRRVCEDCKQEYTPPPPLVEDIKKILGNLLQAKHAKLSEQEEKDLKSVEGKSGYKLVKGKGCEKCGDSGYKGRIAIFEVLPVSDKVGRLILERSPAGKIEEQGVEDGMVRLIQDGYLKTLEGITTIEEILRVSRD
jgi:type II secretory ATPase GspE/PulE/Tfp pilus assembly ATPase PilB-like protein